jgi:hypothetical protein
MTVMNDVVIKFLFFYFLEYFLFLFFFACIRVYDRRVRLYFFDLDLRPVLVLRVRFRRYLEPAP